MNLSINIIVFLAVVLPFADVANAMAVGSWICTPCTQEECDKNPPNLCIWGETRDACNRRICAKGPGERCGGVANILGTCGEGMMCKSDERCHGCSIQTLECAD